MINTANVPFPDESWYRDVVVGAAELIDIVDPEGVILYTNAKPSVPGDTIIGNTIYHYFYPEYHEAVREKIKATFETGEADYYELATDYGDGVERWYMTRLGPIIRDGKIVAVTLFIRDITELKKIQQRLNQMNSELEQRVEERTRELNEYAHRLEAILKLNSALRQTRNRTEVLEILSRQSLQSFHADLVGIYLIDDGKLEYSIGKNHLEQPPLVLTPETDPEFYQLLLTNQPRYFELAKIDDKGCTICGFIEKQNIQVMLVIPLYTQNTRVGVMYLGFRSIQQLSLHGEQMVNSFAEAANNTLQRIQVLEQLEQNIFHREQELSVLYEIMSAASETDQPDGFLQNSLEKTIQTVACKGGMIHLLEGEQLKPSAKFTVDQDVDLEALNHAVLKSKFTQSLGFFKERYLIRSLPSQNLSWLAIPIRVKGMNLGLISLFSQRFKPTDLETIHLVTSIADQVGLAVESARQRKRAEESLIIAERQRLARDLHDSVSQSLYGLVLSADVGNKLLKIKEYEALADTLSDIGRVSLQSLKEMRLMLFELRPLSFETEGLAGALELRLSAVEKRAGIETELEISGREHIPARVELELYRIVTEALNNSLKHANASLIHVSIVGLPEKIQIDVRDNGKGFDSQTIGAGGIGLTSMKERSQRLGGAISISSFPQQGTRIQVDIPCAHPLSPEKAIL